MNRESEDGRSSWFGVWFAVGVILFYVLSIGPAAMAHRKTTNPRLRTTIEVVYTPVVWLMNTPARKPLELWVKLWVD